MDDIQELKSNHFKANLKFKELIPLFISFIALIVSMSSFYFQNIRIDNHLYSTPAVLTKDSNNLIIYIAYYNEGNRQSILLNPLCQVGGRKEHPESPICEGFDINENFPVLIQPRETKLIRLSLAMDKLTSNPHIGRIDKGNDKYTYSILPIIKAIDYKGESCDKSFGASIMVTCDNSGFISDMKPDQSFFRQLRVF